MSQLKKAPRKEPDPEVDEALDLNIDFDEPDISILDNDDDAKQPSDGLDDSTPRLVKRRHFLSNDERQCLVHDFIRRMTDDGKLKKGSIYELMDQYAISERVTRKYWAKIKQQFNENGTYADLSLNMKGRVGPKRKDREYIKDQIESVHYKHRKSLRALKAALMVNGVNISISTLSRMKEEGDDFDKKSTRLKPLLTSKHEYDRFEFCKSKLNDFTHTFVDNYDSVHIDEKWFNLTTANESYWKTKNEDTVHRSSKSKRFILKNYVSCSCCLSLI